ncbi:MAG: hypothetical protein A3K65_09835 [Euryarchaeota archaeon RBG_16_68_12]|nr:MAG: hypothetical protein A3K65_09835 [Euryarchaeota archaeon RBG_16_68_12]
MLLVKFGGSVITVKSKYRTLRGADLSRLARELAAAHDPEAGTVLVHGAGSYGHILAAKHRLKEGFRDDAQLTAVAQVQRDVRALDLKVLDALLRARLRPIAIPPGTDAVVDKDGRFHLDTAPFEDYRMRGFLPVSFGDVVRDEGRLFTIASGDDVVLELARFYRPERVLFVADVDGVFTADPKRDRAATLLDVVDGPALERIAFSDAAGRDVTGGLRAKLERMREIAGVAKDVRIINGLAKGRLERAAKGGDVPGTRVVA